LACWDLIGLGIALLGTQTGGSLNPARQFGPAVVSGHADKLWVFLMAPMVGAEVAARLLKAFQQRRQVLTHRLCGIKVAEPHWTTGQWRPQENRKSLRKEISMRLPRAFSIISFTILLVAGECLLPSVSRARGRRSAPFHRRLTWLSDRNTTQHTFTSRQ